MEKRYQVFVSSTYTDLKEERWKAIQAVIELDCIPAGMELFPAIDEEQFEFIRKVIDDCDYYILIISGRYGSTTSEGISYTEKEYDYAVGKELKVIALIHENPEDIPFGKSEKDPILRERLEQFKKKVSGGRLVKYWKSVEELYNHVTVSLVHTMNKFPAVGWIRANKVASLELLAEINDLRKQNAQLQAASAEFKPALENLAGLEDTMVLHGTYFDRPYNRRTPWIVTLTWSEIFAYVSPYMVRIPNDEYVKSILTTAAFARSGEKRSDNTDPKLDDQNFRTVAVQLTALGLVKLQYAQTVGNSMGLFWSLTPSGERLMVELRTVKKKVNAPAP
jgi:Domain of unknown function (DUF4062)